MRVLKALDALDAAPAGRPRVVIVMSDHGTEVFSADPVTGLRAHVANLFASRMPDGRNDPFGVAPATVDLFPVLLNQLFNSEHPAPGGQGPCLDRR